jgi:hypothetical protein
MLWLRTPTLPAGILPTRRRESENRALWLDGRRGEAAFGAE